MPAVLGWLEATSVATWARESGSLWSYPTILTLHTVGLSIVVGANAVVDLRLLGFAPRLPLASLTPLFPLIWWGFVINASSGVILFMADATIKAYQPVFYVKLALIALALLDTAAVRRTVFAPDAEPGRASRRGRWLAGASLLLWAGAIAAGRLMAYL
jgi:hypothetical protein